MLLFIKKINTLCQISIRMTLSRSQRILSLYSSLSSMHASYHSYYFTKQQTIITIKINHDKIYHLCFGNLLETKVCSHQQIVSRFTDNLFAFASIIIIFFLIVFFLNSFRPKLSESRKVRKIIVGNLKVILSRDLEHPNPP